jgi:hypothetical protein
LALGEGWIKALWMGSESMSRRGHKCSLKSKKSGTKEILQVVRRWKNNGLREILSF